MPDPQKSSVVVTGSSRGIGAAIAKELHNAGYGVVGVSRSNQEQQSDLTSLSFDLRAVHRLEECWRKIEEGGTDIRALVLNAGTGHVSRLVDEDEVSCHQLFSLNFVAPYLLAGHAVRYWHRTSQEGHLIFIGSQVALPGQAQALNSLYSASKAALLSLVASLAKELAPQIRVNGVAPGDVHTELAMKSAKEFMRLSPLISSVHNYETAVLERSLLKRWVEPGEVARSVLYLVENQAITGTILNVSAGATIY